MSARGALTPGRRAALLSLALALVLILPRIARVAYPRIWAEDEQFVGAAALLERGLHCYRDFVHNNPPVLEHLLALGFRLFGRELMVAEVLSAFFVWLTCLALVRIGRSLAPRVGFWAALLYGCSALVFRYHVFEREIFFGALVALAWALSPREPVRGRWATVAAGGLLALALCVKLSAALALCAYLAWMLAHRRPWRQVLALLTLAVAPCALLLGAYMLRDGMAVPLQLVVFLLAKGTNAPHLLDRLDLLRVLLEPLLVLAIGWFVAGARRIPLRGCAGFACLWIAIELLVKVGFKRTLWPHNFLPLMIPAALFGGRALEHFRGLWRRRQRPAARDLAALVVIALLGVHWSVEVLRWSPPGTTGSPADRVLLHGFGGMRRVELERAAVILRARARPEDVMVSSSDWFPVLAGCLPLYRFWESHGVYAQLERAWREGRLGEYLREQRGKSFQQCLSEGFAEYLPPFLEALRSGRLRFLVSAAGAPLSRAFGGAVAVRRLDGEGAAIAIEEVVR